jgi:hypothetical protein
MLPFLLKSIKNALNNIQKDSLLTIGDSECYFIDNGILELISEFKVRVKEGGKDLKLLSIMEQYNLSEVYFPSFQLKSTAISINGA